MPPKIRRRRKGAAGQLVGQVPEAAGQRLRTPGHMIPSPGPGQGGSRHQPWAGPPRWRGGH